MKTYKLTAELGSVTTTKTFGATNDEAATVDAVFMILDEAGRGRSKKNPWAIGRITLTDSRGKVLQEMEAK